MQFATIIGQEDVKRRLIQTVHENRVSHAQLFLGPEGCGSLALAVAYAQYISCQDRRNDDSCGECSSCRKYQKLIHPDLHFSYPFFARHKEDTALTFLTEWRTAFLANPYLGIDEWRNQLDAENKQANINIAECHQILSKLSLKPFESEYKVLILWLPEYLDKAGNTLLKIIEEPPQKTLFLLVAQNQEQVLTTILSRTQLVKVHRLSNREVQAALVSRYGTDEARAHQVAYLSDGNFQTALVQLNDAPNNNFDIFSNWLRLCVANRGAQVIDFVDTLSKLGRENQKNLLKYGIHLLREGLLLLSGAGELVSLPSEEREFITKVSKAISIAKAEALVNELERSHYHVERNANPKILFLDVSLQFIKILKFNTLPEGTLDIYY